MDVFSFLRKPNMDKSRVLKDKKILSRLQMEDGVKTTTLQPVTATAADA